LLVVDNGLNNNGFVRQWGLYLHERPAKWTISHTYPKTYWEAGTGAEITEGLNLPDAVAKTSIEDLVAMVYFKVTDDYNCEYDTALSVTIESETKWTNAGYYWTFGDGSSADLTDTITHIYKEKGNYKVIYTAISQSGCINTDTLTIVVTAPVSTINAPNAFSPNDDGFNDNFSVKTEGMRNIEMAIFSRNGTRLAVLKGVDALEAGWDGSIGNDGSAVVPPGVYYYHLRGEGLDDKKYNQGGSIQLFK